MNEVATIRFRDADSGEEAVAIVHAENGRVELTLSLRTNGDVALVMSTIDAERVVAALEQATSSSRRT